MRSLLTKCDASLAISRCFLPSLPCDATQLRRVSHRLKGKKPMATASLSYSSEPWCEPGGGVSQLLQPRVKLTINGLLPFPFGALLLLLCSLGPPLLSFSSSSPLSFLCLAPPTQCCLNFKRNAIGIMGKCPRRTLIKRCPAMAGKMAFSLFVATQRKPLHFKYLTAVCFVVVACACHFTSDSACSLLFQPPWPCFQLEGPRPTSC